MGREELGFCRRHALSARLHIILQAIPPDLEKNMKPLTVEQLMAILQEKGYPIARRTVAKYREQLGIPVARLRKELK